MNVVEKGNVSNANWFKKLRRNTLTAIRVFAPFICSLITLIDCVRYFADMGYSYILSSIGGYSLIVTLYFLANSKRMCVWYKTNIYCLIAVHIIGLAYYFLPISFTNYLYLLTIVSLVGIISFFIYFTKAKKTFSNIFH